MKFAHGTLEKEEYQKICSIMMTRNEEMAHMIEEHFSPRDYFLIRNRMIGTGMIGGKSLRYASCQKDGQGASAELTGRWNPMTLTM